MSARAFFLAALLGAGAAAAQDSSAAYPPYRFGMSMAQVRAATVGHNWERDTLPDGRAAFFSTSIQRIGDLPFVTGLLFEGDGLRAIGFLSRTPVRDLSECTGLAQRVLSDLERRYGPFNSSASAEEYGEPDSSIQTVGGSVMRLYEREGAAVGFAIRRGAPYVLLGLGFGEEALPEEGIPGPHCGINFELEPEGPPSRDSLAADIPAAAELEAAQALPRTDWVRPPNPAEHARYYPPSALERGVAGRVVLDCLVAAQGRLRCAIASEEPLAAGFAQAALASSRSMQMATEIDGQSSIGRRVRVPMQFRTEE
jgi:TonB family protein